MQNISIETYTTDQSKDIFFSLDENWTFKELNCSAADMIGRKAEDMIGKNIWDESPELIGTVLEDTYRNAMNNHAVQRVEAKYSITDTWYHIFIFPNDNGIAVYWQDITENSKQKETECAILRAKEHSELDSKRIETILDTIPSAIVVVDAVTQKIALVNKRALELHGINYVGYRLKDHEMKIKALKCDGTPYPLEEMPVTYSIKYGKEIRNVEMKVLRADGKYLTVSVSSAPLFNLNGEINSAIVIFEDISERKNSEEKLAESKLRAVALIEELRKSNKNKSLFISHLSHELRNPLASIMMSNSLLKQVDPNTKQAEKAKEVIDRQLSQISHLVDDLLDVTRITQNKIKLTKKIVEFNSFIRNLAADYLTQITEKGINLIVDYYPDPIFLEADKARLKQVFANLLSNALKFTEKGDLIFVSITRDEQKSEVLISVRDTGLGFSPTFSSQLFEPFSQADDSIDHSYGGLGLGLTIAKSIVELHNGSIGAYSEGIGKGAQFTIHLPLFNEEDISSHCETVPALPIVRPLKLLIIEDNEDLLEIMYELLISLGHEVIAASNGIDGIKKAKECHPEVLICDIGLPGMDGYEIAETFCRDKELKSIFRIALSGYAQVEDLERSKAAGFQRHLAKPLRLDLLKTTLAEACS